MFCAGCTSDDVESRTQLGAYATTDTFLACYLGPPQLAESELANFLPWEEFDWPPIVARRRELGAEELVIFAAPAPRRTDERLEPFGRLQLSAAARLEKPLDVAAFLKRSLDAGPETESIDGRTCFRVPAGTLLNLRRRYGKQRFTDRTGAEQTKGINVGRVHDVRGFVEGRTESSSIHTFSGITQRDLIADQLPLELQLDVFLTRRLPTEFAVGTIVLRNPVTKIRTKAIQFDADSHQTKRIDIARKQISSSGAAIDLIDDLVAKGKLEIVLSCEDEATYIGVGEKQLYLRSSASEFVCASKRELLVAQSREALKAMLAAKQKPTELAEKLARSANDGTLIVDVKDKAQKEAWRHVCRATNLQAYAPHLVTGLAELNAVFDLDSQTTLRADAQMHDRTSAVKSAEQLQGLLKKARDFADWELAIYVQGDAGGRLLSLIFQGVSCRFPRPDDMEECLQQFFGMIDETLEGVSIVARGKSLQIEVESPEGIASPSENDNLLLGWFEEQQAKRLFELGRFDLAQKRHRRVTDRLPDSTAVWFRRAHQMSYNMSVEYDAYERRYDCVSRGIHILLDDAEARPESYDMVWMAGRFLVHKVGSDDERAQYRKFFSNDKSLHARLSKYIDLDQAVVEGRIDNDLAAQLLFEYCVERLEADGAESLIPPILVYSSPANARALHAQSLDEVGRNALAAAAWREAEGLYEELGKRAIPWGEPETVTLDALPDPFPTDPDRLRRDPVLQARKWIDYDYWLSRCRLEQTERLRTARRLAREAKALRDAGQPRNALKLFEQGLAELNQARRDDPDAIELAAHDLWKLYRGQDELLTAMGVRQKPELAEIARLLKQSRPRPWFPLLEDLKYVKVDALQSLVEPETVDRKDAR